MKLRALAACLIMAVVAVGQSVAQTIPLQRALDLIRTSCWFCGEQYRADMAGCEDTGDLDTDAEQCRAWAYGEWRRCVRSCWDDENTPLLVYGLWRDGLLTSEQVVEAIYDAGNE